MVLRTYSILVREFVSLLNVNLFKTYCDDVLRFSMLAYLSFGSCGNLMSLIQGIIYMIPMAGDCWGSKSNVF